MHLAIKCTYHDGPSASGFPGFEGTCTPENIEYNINKAKKVWCSQPGCPCRQWLDTPKPRGPVPQGSCWESEIFGTWSMGTGIYHNGPRTGEAFVPRQHHDGAITLLTTVEPLHKDRDRLVIGVLGSTALTGPDVSGAHHIQGSPSFCLRLQRKDWLPYYKFLNSDRTTRWWGTGLIRYLHEEEVGRYLSALAKQVQEPHERRIVDALLAGLPFYEDGGDPGVQVPAPKYSRGGEGPEHKALKQKVFEDPSIIGLRGVTWKMCERSYRTGDRVDIAFEAKGKRVVVEIEVEGEEFCRTGALQAVKYRALEAAETLESADPARVRAFLVAKVIPPSVRTLCKKLGIKAVEVKLD